MTMSDLDLWQSVLQQVRQGDADPQLQTLLPALHPEFLSAELLDVTSPSELPPAAQDRLCGQLAEAASRAWGRRIKVRVRPQPSQLDLPFSRRAATEPDEQLRLNPNYTFDNFVAAPNNRLAHAACSAVCDAPGQAYNPLFLHGTVGLGKSHLLQATCHRLIERQPNVKILYLSCESFVNQFIASVERGDLERFRYRYRHLDALVIDDIHFLTDKERTQEEFFHTFNTLYQSQKQVILSSDSPPQDIPNLEERLVSRFKWGLVARLDKPSFETRVAIVTKKARLRDIQMPDEVIQYIARTCDSNIRELEGAVIRVAAQSKLTGAALTLEMAKGLLSDSASRPAREITVPEIIEVIVRHYGLRVSELQSKKRNKSIAVPRQVGMYLARRLTKLSLEEIGGYFGGRDHTTVLHAERKIEEEAAHDPGIRATMEKLSEEVRTASAAQAG